MTCQNGWYINHIYSRAQLQNIRLQSPANFTAQLLRRFKAALCSFRALQISAVVLLRVCVTKLSFSHHRWTNGLHGEWICCYKQSKRLLIKQTQTTLWDYALISLQHTNTKTHTIRNPHLNRTIPFGTCCHLHHLAQLWWWARRLPTWRLDQLQGYGWWFCCSPQGAVRFKPPHRSLRPVLPMWHQNGVYWSGGFWL